MIRLSTIGQVSVHIGDKPVPATNELIIAAILHLVAERGRPIARRTFAELFFPNPDPDAVAHSGRQLVYRLRKMGLTVDRDPALVILHEDAQWDVDLLLARGTASESELEALRRGYLPDWSNTHSESFSRWLDEHRSSVTGKLRELLVRQIQAARSKRDYRTAGKFAHACLGLDPLNEAATLAAAESLAATGAKTDAIHLLNRYLDDVGPRSDLRIAPRLLRERISEYVVEPDRDQTALIGRSEELETLRRILDESAAGRPQICLISGPGGIGKTRLVEEACSIAALTGHAISHVRLTAPDADRPFAILRELGPTLLELPGALGAAPETLAAVRGLCGRGPAQYVRRPANAYDSRAVAADIQRKVVDLVNAVTDEQPLVIRIENADHIDEASLEVIEALVGNEKRLCVLMAARMPLRLSDDTSLGLAVSRVRLAPLKARDSGALLLDLFNQTDRDPNPIFVENAVKVSVGVPLFLHLLFKNFLVSEDPSGLPATLWDSLAARLDRLQEPAKGVFDAVVVLGALSSVGRIERLTELPRYSLAEALRTLEEQGFLRFTDGAVLASHDLLADATRRRMPPSVSRLLHRAVARSLEDDEPEVDPLEIAIHWQEAGENARASEVLVDSARRAVAHGRPRQAIVLLQRVNGWATSTVDRIAIDTAYLEACHAAGEDHLGFAAAERIDGFSLSAPAEVQLMGIELAVGAGKAVLPFRQNLETAAKNRKLSPLIRNRAARLLMIIADDIGDVSLGEAALALVADADDSSTEAIIPRLIFQVVFGSTDSAIDLANRLVVSIGETTAKGLGLQARWTAAAALWRCGETERALEVAEKGFEIAKANSVWSACTTFASSIGDLAWETGDVQKSQEWFYRSSEMIKRSGGPDRGFHHLGLGISLALHRNDPQEALAMIEEAERLFPETMNARLGVSFLAHRVLIRIALGESPTQDEVERLVKGHYERQGLGFHDFVAEATIASLRHHSRFAEANAIREAYLTGYRKERRPVSPLFTHLAQ
jgi:DNA-binding SARP family transcriptional activator/tetratricopeptide (TPR) repeat protein